VKVAQAHDLTLGDNQDLFVSYFSNVDGWHLLRLSASTGEVLWNDAVSGGVPVSTTGGVVLVSAGAVQPVSAAGSIGSTTAYAAGMAPVLYSVAHNDQGDVLALNLPQWVNGSCGNTTGPATVTELDPSGTQLWTREIPMSGASIQRLLACPASHGR
jgi:outer membrane protein assembly factor BamB